MCLVCISLFSEFALNLLICPYACHDGFMIDCFTMYFELLNWFHNYLFPNVFWIVKWVLRLTILQCVLNCQMGFTINCFTMCFELSNGFQNGFTIDCLPIYFELLNGFHDEFHIVTYKKFSWWVTLKNKGSKLIPLDTKAEKVKWHNSTPRIWKKEKNQWNLNKKQ